MGGEDWEVTVGVRKGWGKEKENATRKIERGLDSEGRGIKGGVGKGRLSARGEDCGWGGGVKRRRPEV